MFSQTQKGIFLALWGTFLFSLMNVVAKSLSETMTSNEIVFFRGLIGSFIAIGFLIFKEKDRRIKNHKLLVLRGFLGGLTMLGTFYTIAHIKLGDASLLFNLSPIFVVILAWLFLKERLPKLILLLLLLAFIGAIAIIKPGLSGMYNQNAIVGVLAAMAAGGASVCIRKLSFDHSPYLIMLYFMVVATIISLPLAWPEFVWPNLSEWALILLMSGFSFFALLAITQAFKFEKSGIVAMTRYSDVVFNVTWGYLLWGEVLDTYSFIGGSCIVLSCVLLVLSRNSNLQKFFKRPQSIKQPS